MKLSDARASCSDCGKEWTSKNAQGVAAQHSRKYGHKVTGELYFVFAFGVERKREGRGK